MGLTSSGCRDGAATTRTGTGSTRTAPACASPPEILASMAETVAFGMKTRVLATRSASPRPRNSTTCSTNYSRGEERSLSQLKSGMVQQGHVVNSLTGLTARPTSAWVTRTSREPSACTEEAGMGTPRGTSTAVPSTAVLSTEAGTDPDMKAAGTLNNFTYVKC